MAELKLLVAAVVLFAATTQATYYQAAVDGSWGSWGSYGSCSSSCGGGVQRCSRKCNNPAPANGGKKCVGPSTRTHSCNTNVVCPANPNWGSWGPWGPCSKTCGIGSKTRSRKCNNPAPAPGHKGCVGPSQSSRPFNTGVPCLVGCLHGGKRYPVGPFIPASCSARCNCLPNGLAACISLCPLQRPPRCTSNEVLKYKKVAVPGSKCFCTFPYCAKRPIGCLHGGKRYPVGPFIPASCNARCNCLSNGHIACVSLCPPSVIARCNANQVLKYKSVAVPGTKCSCRRPYCANKPRPKYNGGSSSSSSSGRRYNGGSRSGSSGRRYNGGSKSGSSGRRHYKGGSKSGSSGSRHYKGGSRSGSSGRRHYKGGSSSSSSKKYNTKYNPKYKGSSSSK